MHSIFPKNVVAIHAHPDDTEIFCAGTLKLLADCGYSVTIVTLTPGGMGGINSTEKKTIALRKKEAQKAAELINAGYICLDGRDGYLFDTLKLRLDVLKIIRQKEAGIIITHRPDDYHSDHRATCQIVDASAMLSSLPNVPLKEKPLEVTPLLYHSAPLGLSDPLGRMLDKPHFYVNVGSVMETKMQMLECHQSQIDLMRVMHKMDDFYGEMKKLIRSLGTESGCEFAEAFWQHLGGGYQKNSVLQEALQKFLTSNAEKKSKSIITQKVREIKKIIAKQRMR